MVTYREFWDMSHEDRVKIFQGMSTSVVLMYCMNIIDTCDLFTDFQKNKGKSIIMENYKTLSKVKNPYVRAEMAFQSMIAANNKLMAEIRCMNSCVNKLNTDHPQLRLVR